MTGREAARLDAAMAASVEAHAELAKAKPFWRPHQDAKWNEVWVGVVEDQLRSWIRRVSPSGVPSHRKP